MSNSPTFSLDVNETFFSALQDVLRDQHGDEIISSQVDDVIDNQTTIDSITTSTGTVYKWIFAIICSAVIGLAGLLPVFVTPDQVIQVGASTHKADKTNALCQTCDSERNLQNSSSTKHNGNNNVKHRLEPPENGSSSSNINDKLKFMLSFAVGGLLGDVFLHLLPEAHYKLYLNASNAPDPVTFIHNGHITIGLWILLGILTFVFIEMIFNVDKSIARTENDKTSSDTRRDNSGHNNIDIKTDQSVMLENDKQQEVGDIRVSGYLNLVANCIDNFSHGLAVGGAFLISTKVGFTTTLCILVHEIPHEIGDFAILIKSGFTRYDAARAQMSTAGLGMCGALMALALDTFMNIEEGGSIEDYTSWIIPFTCGGFINISLVTVLPGVLESNDIFDCLRTLGGIGLGIFIMMGVSSL